MIRINLLPHREERKAQHRRRFQVLAFATAGAALLLSFLACLYMSGMVSRQNDANGYLKQEIGKLDKEIVSIKALRQEKEALLARKALVEGLQNGRGDAVRLFDQIIRKTPDGVYLSKVEQKGNTLKLYGFGMSNARVSDYIKSLSNSDFFSSPKLGETQSILVNNRRLNSFVLSVQTEVADTGKVVSAH